MRIRRILLAVAMLALALPAWQKAEARTDVSIDFFYDNLGDGGNWVEVADYGYCWQPTVAVSNRTWRPYSDGYWAYTDVGWTWISYEDFGWATYHYGRWLRLRGRGWVWVLGREWGPAWVSWRTGGDYVGWAPLPPRRAGEYWDESPITAQVDVEFDIGPSYYNFVDVRYIGEPVLRERIFASDQNVNYITKTVNVTNITYTNSTVYNYGPDYNTLSRYSNRPIQRLSLQRETNVDPAAAAQSKSLMKIQGDKLVVAAPQQFQKPAKTIAPKVVKEKIAQTPVERGWEQVSDQKTQRELKEKIKKEDPKNIPPPTVPASDKSAAIPAPSAPPTTAPTTTPSTSAGPAAAASTKPENKRNKRYEKTAPSIAPKPPRKEKQEKNVQPPAPAPAPPQSLPDQSSLHSAPPPPITRPEKVEKPKIESATDAGPKVKKEVQERVQPPSTSNPAANAPGKEDGRQKKPSTSPSP